jgi:hypothetical protein
LTIPEHSASMNGVMAARERHENEAAHIVRLTGQKRVVNAL